MIRFNRLLICAAFLAPVVASAQSADTTKLTFDLGLVNTAGNTNITTFNLGNAFSYIAHPWVFSEAATMVYGASHDTVNNDQYHAIVRTDYGFSTSIAAYGYVGFDRNRFAGLVSRYQEAVGLAWQAVAAASDKLGVEAGLSENQQRNSGGTSTNYPAARVAANYKHLLTAASFVQEAVEILPDLKQSKNLQVNSETDLVAPISKKIALKVAYIIRFDNLPPPGFKKTDRTLTTGVQIAF